MKLSLNWLKDYVSPGINAETLAQRLTMAGLEVEKMWTQGKDTLMELEVTPNRPDCLSVTGLAREVGAILKKSWEMPTVKRLPAAGKKCVIKNEAKGDCRRYIGYVIEEVQIHPSPLWIQKRLTALEMRPIHNAVDITNFCLWELGQPLHVFDYDRLKGGQIIVRRAREGERIVTLDGVERKLDPSVLVIADQERPVAIAGIMGGKAAEVTPQTTRILLESAYFDPILIRRTARHLRLNTDSSYRFERGVDYEGVATAARRALSLILQTTGGRLTRQTDRRDRPPRPPRPIDITIQRITAALGKEVSVKECVDILRRLGFSIDKKTKEGFRTTPPSFRSDVKADVDLIEEVARVIGYDRLPASMPVVSPQVISPPGIVRARRAVSRQLRACGLTEIITYALMSREALTAARQDLPVVAVKNPLSREQEILRPSLLAGFLAVARGNINRGRKDLFLFEIGKVYGKTGERETVGLLMTGMREADWRRSCLVDFYDIKGVVEGLAEALRVKEPGFTPSDLPFLVEGHQARVNVGRRVVGYVGRVAGDVLRRFQIRVPEVFYAEIDLEGLCALPARPLRYRRLDDYPPVARDISLAAPVSVSFQEIRRLALSHGQGLLKEVLFKELYIGDQIPRGYRGLVFSLIYQSDQRTLREEEVQVVHDAIEKALSDQLGTIRR